MVRQCGHRRPFGWPIITTMPMQRLVVLVMLVGWEEGVSVEAVREGRRWRGYCIGLGQEAAPEEEEEVCRGLVGTACP